MNTTEALQREAFDKLHPKNDEVPGMLRESFFFLFSKGWEAALAAAAPSPVAIVRHDELSRDPDGDIAIDYSNGVGMLTMSITPAGRLAWAVSSAVGSPRPTYDSGHAEVHPEFHPILVEALRAADALTAAPGAHPAPTAQTEPAIDEDLLAMYVPYPSKLHPDTARLVSKLAFRLAIKLRKAEQKYGYSDGWRDDRWKDECQKALAEHVVKGDPLDVAAYCAFCLHHDWPTAAPMLNGLTASEPSYRDKAQKLLDAAHDFWQSSSPRVAVRWLSASDDALVIFTRGEYRETLMSNIDKLPGESVTWLIGEADEDRPELRYGQRAASETAETASVAGLTAKRYVEIERPGSAPLIVEAQGEVPAEPSAEPPMIYAMGFCASASKPSSKGPSASQPEQMSAIHGIENELTDEQILDRLDELHQRLTKTGRTNGAMVGVLWNCAAYRFAFAAGAASIARDARLSLTDTAEALRNLVDALDRTNWSSWQTTASFSAELERARAILAAAQEKRNGEPT